MGKFFTGMLVYLVFGTSAHADTPLRVVVDEWAPFGAESLPGGGISLSVITEVLNRAGYEVEGQIVPFARALSGARSGEYDIVGNLFYDTEMAQDLQYGDPYYQTTVQFIQQSGNDIALGALDDLYPFSVAVGEGYLYSDSFDSADNFRRVTVTTVEQGVRMVASGRVDLTLDSVDVLHYIFQVLDPSLQSQVDVLPYVLATQEIHMAVRRDLENVDQVIADFNATLAEMREDGSLENILSQFRF